jgi:Raf kinase inhibitor-like YbhB/YbcL family protein
MPVGSIRSRRELTARRIASTAGRRGPLHTKDVRGFAKLALACVLIFLVASVMAAKDSSGKLELTTTAFRPGGTVPTQFTCSGANISPALSWNTPPPRTQSFVLIVDDPDAPGRTWVHWVVYDLPASARQLPENVPRGDTVAGGGEQGLNDFPMRGYGGPCPPPGNPHRYFFRLYALDTILHLRAPARRRDVDAAMQRHVLAQAELTGTFGR